MKRKISITITSLLLITSVFFYNDARIHGVYRIGLLNKDISIDLSLRRVIDCILYDSYYPRKFFFFLCA